MGTRVMLATDVLLGALIGPPGCLAENVIQRVESGEWTPVVPDLALFCAVASVRVEDTVDHARFARLMRHAEFTTVINRRPGMPHDPPSESEIEHWRNVALGASQKPDPARVKALAEGIRSALAASARDRHHFLDVAERLAQSKDPAEQKRLKEELARLTFGG